MIHLAPSLRAQRSNPESLRGKTLDCFTALAMTIWRARAPYEKNAIFSAWVMRRIGAMGSLAAARGFCRMPLARMVAPSEGSGRDADKGEGIGSVAVGAAPNVAAAAMAGAGCSITSAAASAMASVRRASESIAIGASSAGSSATAVAAGSAATGSGSSAAIGRCDLRSHRLRNGRFHLDRFGDLVELRIGRGHFQRDGIEYGFVLGFRGGVERDPVSHLSEGGGLCDLLFGADVMAGDELRLDGDVHRLLANGECFGGAGRRPLLRARESLRCPAAPP